MGVIIIQFYVLGLKFLERAEVARKGNGGKRLRRTRELLLYLLAVIFIHMVVAESMHEFSGLTAQYLRENYRKERVARDIERNAEEDVGGALIQLQADFAVLDIDLVHV